MTTRVQQFDFSVDLLRALLWQDNKATTLAALLKQKQAWYADNVSTFWENWITDVFDIRTANQFGLAVWAIVLGLPLEFIAPENQGPQFGFGPASNGRVNFGHGNFGTSQAGVGLTLDQKRILLRLRYYRLISRCSVTEINAMLAELISPYGKMYVLDGLDMTMTYVYTFPPNSKLQFVLENFDILPRPAGVMLKFISGTRQGIFGFGSFNDNFNNGTFGAGTVSNQILDTNGDPLLDTNGNFIFER